MRGYARDGTTSLFQAVVTTSVVRLGKKDEPRRAGGTR